MAYTQTQKLQPRRFVKRLPIMDRLAVSLAAGVSSWQLALLGVLALLAILVGQFTGILAQYSFARAYILRTASISLAFAVTALVLSIGFQAGFSFLRHIARWIGLIKVNRSAFALAQPVRAWDTRVLEAIRWAVCVALVSGAVGAVGNIAATLYGSYEYDDRLRKARDTFYAGTGCFSLNSQSENSSRVIYCRKPDGNFEVRLPLLEMPTHTRLAFEILEDRGVASRLSSFNIWGVTRAFYTIVRNTIGATDGATLQGGSGIAEQLAGLLLDLRPRGERTAMAALSVKVEKFIAGLRASDIYKDDVLRTYADFTSYGSVSGYEIKGFAAASRFFYGRQPAQLTLAESFELAGRIQNSRTHFPFKRPNEDQASFEQRLNRQRTRLRVAFDNAVGQGQIERTDANAVLNEIFGSLRSFSDIRSHLIISHRDIFLRELQNRIPDSSSRFLEIETNADQSAQKTLEEAVSQARLKVEQQLKVSQREDLAVDAVVLDANGDQLAQMGQARTRGDGCSIFKPWLYELALELGILKSIDADVIPGLSGRQALVFSVNQAALKVIQEIGPSQFKTRLEANGFSVVCACAPIALGAGVDSSPLEVAASFHQFGFSEPGFRVRDEGFIKQIRDMTTGQTLFVRSVVPSVRADYAIAVRSALQDASLYGTAKFLRPLAMVAPIAAKTGTSAFQRDGRWQGNGGSWIVASDSRTGVTVVVRMRLRSAHPFHPEGGSSAVLVAYQFISKWRERNTR